MEIKLDLLQTVGLAVCVFLLGRWIKSKVKFFQKYFIPAPVIGGLIASVVIFAALKQGWFTLKMTNTLQDFFMNLFFTGTGFTCSIAVIKKSGRTGACLAVGAVLLLVVQNLVGIGLATAFGLNKLLGVAMGAISMSGGVGSGASFGPTLEAAGALAAPSARSSTKDLRFKALPSAKNQKVRAATLGERFRDFVREHPIDVPADFQWSRTEANERKMRCLS